MQFSMEGTRLICSNSVSNAVFEQTNKIAKKSFDLPKTKPILNLAGMQVNSAKLPNVRIRPPQDSELTDCQIILLKLSSGYVL